MRSTVRLAAVLAVAWSVGGGLAMAAPGDLDSSFSGDGKVTTNFGPLGQSLDVAIQPNGKVVAVGAGPLDGRFPVARYLPTGALDTTFGGDGKVLADYGSTGASTGSAAEVALQDDRRIVVVGSAGGDQEEFGIARFLPNGEPDRSFAGDGTKTLAPVGEEGFSGASAVAIDPAGKIVVTGTRTVDVGFSSASFVVARLNPDGSLDQSFSDDGQVAILPDGPNSFRPYNVAEDVEVSPTGRVLVAGHTEGRIALVGLRPDGSPDPAFSGDGIGRTRFLPRKASEAYAFDLQRDGRIVVAGAVYPGTTNQARAALARYLPNGEPDRTFAGDGSTVTSFPGKRGEFHNVGFHDVVVQDGRVVAAGSAAVRPGRMGVARYRVSGALDRKFSKDGRRTVLFGGSGQDEAFGVALYPSGGVVVGGVDRRGGEAADFALARLKG